MAEHQLSEADDGATVEAGVGDVIALSLGEMAAGGYRWTIDSAATDALEAAPPTYEFDAGKVGGGSVAHFGFTVTRTGTSTLRLEYKRPWEESEPPLRS